ncbi:MAG: hypothetical protein ACYCYI_00430 [Saccharofermentanales bacterium]
MPEQKETKVAKVRPELSNFIEDKLDGDIKQSLLDFIEYCKADKMAVKLSSGYMWSVHYKGKRVASIEITVKGMCRGQYTHKDNSWIIAVCYLDVESLEFENFIKSENLSEIIWENISYCKGCLKTCIGNQPPGLNKKIAGKVFDKVSVCGYIKFKNPGIEELVCIKKLMGIRKNNIIAL